MIEELKNQESLKICVSSRPERKFIDALKGCPQIQMQDMTQNDIRRYISGSLHHPKVSDGSVSIEQIKDKLIEKSGRRFPLGLYYCEEFE